ncbi:MAG: K(+)-transporting ATPase subunit F [Steroidobacteraceae bacterium]
MSPVDLIGLLLAVALFVYLVVALLYPEKFQ